MEEFDKIINEYKNGFLSTAEKIFKNPNNLEFEKSFDSITISLREPEGKLSPILSIKGFFNNKTAAARVSGILTRVNDYFGSLQINIAKIKRDIENNGIAKTF